MFASFLISIRPVGQNKCVGVFLVTSPDNCVCSEKLGVASFVLCVGVEWKPLAIPSAFTKHI